MCQKMFLELIAGPFSPILIHMVHNFAIALFGFTGSLGAFPMPLGKSAEQFVHNLWFGIP